MPFAALSRSRAFQLLLVALLQFGLASSTQGSCPTSGSAPLSCCAGVMSAVTAAQTVECCDNGLPVVPEPADGDPGCLCVLQPGPVPVPTQVLLPGDLSPTVELLRSHGGTEFPPTVIAQRGGSDPPWLGHGPPIYRLYCVFLI